MPGFDRFLREIKVADASRMRSITEVSSHWTRTPRVEGVLTQSMRANGWDRRLDPTLWPRPVPDLMLASPPVGAIPWPESPNPYEPPQLRDGVDGPGVRVGHSGAVGA